MPKKRFGQNFLINSFIAKRIVEESGTKKGENVLEIGAGKGILTRFLLKKGAHVIAFEIDKDLFEELKMKFEDENVTFIFQDFLRYQREVTIDRCVSNIPYNVSTPILKKLFKLDVPSITLMVQKEYAERLTAHPGTKAYGSLSVFTQIRYNVEKLFKVERGNFYPRPCVDSMVIRLEKNDMLLMVKNVEIFERVVRAAFSSRRKMLKNNLRRLISVKKMESSGISPTARAEELEIRDFIRLANVVTQNRSVFQKGKLR